jgi:hypothetical protein
MDFFDSQTSFASTREPFSTTTGPIARLQTPKNVNRGPPIARWTITSTSMLIEVRRLEAERMLHAGPLRRMSSASQRWDEISNELKMQGVNQTDDQCKSKWERLVTDFKKVFDYQKDKPSGRPQYFALTCKERKRLNLPPSFDEEIYNLMECWLPNQQAVNPDRRNLMDSSNVEEEGRSDSQQSEPGDDFDIGNEENIPPPVNTPPANEASASSRPDSYGRRKKTKRDRLDEHFMDSSKALLEAMAAESDKRTVHDQAILEWDKEKANKHLQLELVKLKEDIAARERVGSQVANVLGELVKTFSEFTSQLNKQK